MSVVLTTFYVKTQKQKGTKVGNFKPDMYATFRCMVTIINVFR